jgi:hypothetical protein
MNIHRGLRLVRGMRRVEEIERARENTALADRIRALAVAVAEAVEIGAHPGVILAAARGIEDPSRAQSDAALTRIEAWLQSYGL